MCDLLHGKNELIMDCGREGGREGEGLNQCWRTGMRLQQMLQLFVTQSKQALFEEKETRHQVNDGLTVSGK